MSKDDVELPDFRPLIEDINTGRATVKISLDKGFLSATRKRLEPYKRIPYTFRPALEQVANYVRTEMIPRTFEREGPNWAPLAPMTRRLRAQAGYGAEHPILYREGDLFRELTEKSHPKHVEIIRVGKDAHIEIGGSSNKFTENQMGGPRLPARPMIPGTGDLPLPDRDRIAMRDILVKAMKRRTT